MKRTQSNAVFWYGIFVVAVGCTVFLIARQNILTFPCPWNDEARLLSAFLVLRSNRFPVAGNLERAKWNLLGA